MRKGDGTFTQFRFNGDFTTYFASKNYDITKVRQGLIHSHHNMATFFSPEDDDELQLNAPNHNYYLSLIVNNAGAYCAALAQKVTYSGAVTTQTHLDMFGNPISVEVEYPEQEFILKHPVELVYNNTVDDSMWLQRANTVVAQQGFVRESAKTSQISRKTGGQDLIRVPMDWVITAVLKAPATSSLYQACSMYQHLDHLTTSEILWKFELDNNETLGTPELERLVLDRIVRWITPFKNEQVNQLIELLTKK